MFMTRLEAGLTQLAKKAASGDLMAIKEAIRLSREIQDEQTLGPIPQIVVNFVKLANSRNRRPESGIWAGTIAQLLASLKAS